MIFDLNALVRENIKELAPYPYEGAGRAGEMRIYLDANENNFGSPLLKWYNRYPDPLQWKVKEKLGKIKWVEPAQIFLGNGSHECIDILYRIFCEPRADNVIIAPPANGMYAAIAHLNNVEIRLAPLLDDFQLNLAHLEQLIDAHTKIIWLCSPNDPAGNSLAREDVEMVLNNFNGLVVVDEAYINFSRQHSFLKELKDYPNLIVLQTLSKAWGLAGLRVAMMFAQAPIIALANKVKPPYNISQPTQELVLQALENTAGVNDMTHLLVDMRDAMAEVLAQMPMVEKVHASDANFLMVRITEASKVHAYLLARGILVKDLGHEPLCGNYLRITMGTEQENTALIDALADYLETS